MITQVTGALARIAVLILVLTCCTAGGGALPTSGTDGANSLPPTATPTVDQRIPVGDVKNLRIGGTDLFVSKNPELTLLVVRPADAFIYALDTSNVPDGKDACPRSSPGGKGPSGSGEGPTVVIFDCAAGRIYASYDIFGTPAGTNVPAASHVLPAFKVDVSQDGTLLLTEQRLSREAVYEAWGADA